LQLAAAADATDLWVPVTHFGKPCPEPSAENLGPVDEAVAFDDGEEVRATAAARESDT
jgi:hypothetical protein